VCVCVIYLSFVNSFSKPRHWRREIIKLMTCDKVSMFCNHCCTHYLCLI